MGLDWYLRYITTAEEHTVAGGQPRELDKIFASLAKTYGELDEHENAIRFYQRGYEIVKEKGKREKGKLIEAIATLILVFTIACLRWVLRSISSYSSSSPLP